MCGWPMTVIWNGTRRAARRAEEMQLLCNKTVSGEGVASEDGDTEYDESQAIRHKPRRWGGKESETVKVSHGKIDDRMGTELRGNNLYDIRGNLINNYTGNPPPDLHRILSPVGDASHNRPEPVARCHPGTRLKVIAEIEKWIEDSNDCPILWLNGPAGSGKSAISQTIAEHCAGKKKIASFFFLRGTGERSKFKHLMPTLAHQVSMFDSAVESILIDTMRKEPELHGKKALSYQLDELLIKPIKATGLELSKIIIIIDALDECDDKSLICQFIEALATICNTPYVQLPFRLFLTSRVEQHIHEIFNRLIEQYVVKYLSLQKVDATEDIQLYLKNELSSLYERKARIMHNIRGPWPSKEHLEKLSRNAAGSFVIAFTLIKFIGTEKDYPDDNLKKALDMTDGLDPVYHQVISTAVQENKTFQNKQLHILERVLAVIGLAENLLSVNAISVLLERKAHHIVQILLGLQAILLIPEKDDDEPVRLFHTSLRDYLCSEQRSEELCINMQQSHAMLAIRCLQLVVEYSRKDKESKSQDIAIYACEYWLHHLNESLKNEKNQDLVNDITLNKVLDGFTLQSVIYWWTTTKPDMKILEAILVTSIINALSRMTYL
ncbi:hypothetical protein BDQ12DRAFT_764564 [Crucibulum laeve]|uniref:Nephrocystin 3-like N-terminal domain-containing protein n=1 Tax=Crucibulum laeve TaxID=68775 RepID=A0A5C3LLE9_9AGAR|nr:hypothetical protein BDQ12DRAFT_764564 [Crucibulum laeve]